MNVANEKGAEDRTGGATRCNSVSYDFTGTVVLVTGAARGQGRSHALAFAQAGADVIVVDICGPVTSIEYDLATPGELAEVAADIRALGGTCLARQCDVRDPTQVSALFAEVAQTIGPVDVLVNNAGIDGVVALIEMSVEAWDDMLNTHVRGALLMSQAAVPGMRTRGRGRIINIGSISSLLALPSRAHYVTAKHALAGLTKAAAIDLAPYAITVNLVCPGAVHSPLNVVSGLHPEIGPEMTRLVGSWNILAPPGQSPLLEPAEITHAVMWLASDATNYITGAVLVVDAGASIK